MNGSLRLAMVARNLGTFFAECKDRKRERRVERWEWVQGAQTGTTESNEEESRVEIPNTVNSQTKGEEKATSSTAESDESTEQGQSNNKPEGGWSDVKKGAKKKSINRNSVGVSLLTQNSFEHVAVDDSNSDAISEKDSDNEIDSDFDEAKERKKLRGKTGLSSLKGGSND